jgi:hypothetical protein
MRGSEAGSTGRLIIVLDRATARYGASQPLERRAGFCRFIALQSLRAAQERGKERIRVLTPGCECEFGVVELATWARHRERGHGSLVRAGSVRAHQAWGNVFEERRQNWPGGIPRLAEGG